MEKKEDKFLKGLKDFIKSFIVSLLIVILLTQFVVRHNVVDGKSMYPTLHDGDIGLSNILGLRMGDIQRFDIVVVNVPNDERYIVKRVIGLPGDTIEYRNDKLYVNGVYTEEPFLDNEYANGIKESNTYFTADFGPVLVPEGEYFVVGDNRQNSADSRSEKYGTFTRDQIKSKDLFVLYPFSNFGLKGR